MADTGSQVAVVRPTSAAIVTFDEMERMAVAFAKSNLFGVKTPEAALSLLMIAQAEGIHPALAVMEYDIIEGKPARKAERLLARFQLSGGRVEWVTLTDKEVRAKFTHPQGSPCEIDWSIEKASRIRYYTKDGWKPLTGKYNWQSYPRAMLRSRVISEGVRTCFPGASLVTLSTEEAIDGEIVSVEAIVEPGAAEASPPAVKSSYRAKRDGDATWLEEAVAKLRGLGDADDLRASDRWRALPKKWRDSAEDMIEARLEEVAYAEHAANADPIMAIAAQPAEPPPALPFDKVLALLAEAQGAEELKAWSDNHATPERLAAYSDEERASLREAYIKQKSAGERASPTQPAVPADSAPDGSSPPSGARTEQNAGARTALAGGAPGHGAGVSPGAPSTSQRKGAAQ
jgi:hypothetical protein